MTDFLLYAPTVFAVGKEYQIFVRTSRKCSLAVQIGPRIYYDHDNGILRTNGLLRRVSVPMSELDEAGEYTLLFKPLKKRRSYYSEFYRVMRMDFSFDPVPSDGDVRIFHIADTHGVTAAALSAARRFGETDLLILNGDIFENSDKTSNFDVVYRLASEITHGRKPVIFSRGNHDLRGPAAELLSQYMPVCCGKSYYTVRLGRLWFLLLDCGEDKSDDHEEYGGANCCHVFRVEENAFLDRVADDPDSEYRAEGVERVFVISHYPFTHVDEAPFDIEQDIYAHWAERLREDIKPELMICGHTHHAFISEVGSDYDDLGQPCRMVVGSATDKHDLFTGCGITVKDSGIDIEFVDG